MPRFALTLPFIYRKIVKKGSVAFATILVHNGGFRRQASKGKTLSLESRTLDLKGHRALVCGASQGIGKQIAIAFAQAGADVICLARSEDKLSQTLKELPSGNHETLALDLSQVSSFKSKFDNLVKNPITLLVNNAGGPPAGPLMDASEGALVKAFQTHIVAAQFLTQLVVPGMKEKKYGRIINVISTSVKIPIPNLGVSNTIRGAMANWSKTLSSELGPFGITVNNILPGYTATERLDALKGANAEKRGVKVEDVEQQWLESIPARRFGDPYETASAALFLASPLASYINGINLPVDGGRTGSL